jgi:hypothetical protein
LFALKNEQLRLQAAAKVAAAPQGEAKKDNEQEQERERTSVNAMMSVYRFNALAAAYNRR